MVAVVNRANTSVTPSGAGRYRVVKTSGGDGYNASAVSGVAIAGDFVLWARVVSSGTSALVGVTANPDENDSYDTIDNAAHLIGGSVAFYQRGNYYPPAVANDGRIWIGRAGSTLTFRAGLRFATATVLRTVTGVSGPLFLDSSIYNQGGGFDVRFDAPGGWTNGRRPRTAATLRVGLQPGGLQS